MLEMLKVGTFSGAVCPRPHICSIFTLNGISIPLHPFCMGRRMYSGDRTGACIFG
ncbi:hypothetical protein H3T52_07595 [Commensalibacter sp. M0402]|uniref:hypothetical protein n=1 Tax=Commensalibacter TaxID=1079922 RepID=UPI0018DB00B5|nr:MULTISPECIES: hypothetical protein [Commensalibacter]MBI0083598.1 hypothetical protein [Commensalibacter sp. W6292M3]MBI0088807.1 hypothetical protein [Commensalibacter melissae]